MLSLPPKRRLGFLINDVARMLRTLADQRAREFGMTRAQWAVLVRLEHSEGLKQSALAEMLDIQPITLTRLVDRLCESGMIERRPDPNDRRAKLLYLTPAARPLMAQLNAAGEDVMNTALARISDPDVRHMIANLELARETIREAIQSKHAHEDAGATRYG